MAEENKHIQTLLKARERELEHRRNVADALAQEYKPGHTENMRDAFIKIQATIEAIESAIQHEKYLADVQT